jgi:protein-tyrosine phosphatase
MFVCLGNICRSPAGEAILRHLVEEEGLSDEIEVNSCGIGDWHVGQEAHSDMRKAAKKRGYSLNGKAKQFHPDYFEKYDYFLAAERSVLDYLEKLAGKDENLSKIHMLTDFSEEHRGEDVLDPYFGGEDHFEESLDVLEKTCKGFLEKEIMSGL